MTPSDTTYKHSTCQTCVISNQISKPIADKYKSMTIIFDTMHYLTQAEHDLLLWKNTGSSLHGHHKITCKHCVNTQQTYCKCQRTTICQSCAYRKFNNKKTDKTKQTLDTFYPFWMPTIRTRQYYSSREILKRWEAKSRQAKYNLGYFRYHAQSVH